MILFVSEVMAAAAAAVVFDLFKDDDPRKS
jgi:hypothetical protein